MFVPKYLAATWAVPGGKSSTDSYVLSASTSLISVCQIVWSIIRQMPMIPCTFILQTQLKWNGYWNSCVFYDYYCKDKKKGRRLTQSCCSVLVSVPSYPDVPAVCFQFVYQRLPSTINPLTYDIAISIDWYCGPGFSVNINTSETYVISSENCILTSKWLPLFCISPGYLLLIFVSTISAFVVKLDDLLASLSFTTHTNPTSLDRSSLRSKPSMLNINLKYKNRKDYNIIQPIILLNFIFKYVIILEFVDFLYYL